MPYGRVTCSVSARRGDREWMDRSVAATRRYPAHRHGQTVHPVREDSRLSRTPWIAAAIVTVALLGLAGRYGFHRDELYFQITGRHLAFGYVDQPPFTPLIARLESVVFGVSPLAIRVWPAMVAGAVLLLAALQCREPDGGRPAHALVSVGVAWWRR